MNRNYHCLEMVLLLFFSHLKCNGPSSSTQNCSRSRSQIVHVVILKKILPIFHQYKTSFPISCPFHGERDVFWWPDAQKHYHGNQWVCPSCGTTFRMESDFVHHWDKVHHSNNQKEDSVCLASLCDIFRCDVLSVSFNTTESNHLQTSQLTKHTTISGKHDCNESAMMSLRKKCKNVITQCLVEVLAAFSAKDFQDMEAELDASLCSYLTCQRYWDGSLAEVRHVPALFCITLATLLTGVFYVCYQMIWLLLNCSRGVTDKAFCNGYPYPDVTGIKFRSKPRDNFRQIHAHQLNRVR